MMPALLSNDAPQSDRQMVDAALAGDPAAWDRLYQSFHGPLTSAIRSLLKSSDTDFIEELAARVWYSVVRDGGALLSRFDPSRGCRLTTYLSSIAKDHAARMLRSDRRRRRREAISCTEILKAGDGVVDGSGGASFTLDEFERVLTPKEKQFFRELFASADEPASPQESTPPTRTAANQRQLGHRVRCKLERFLNS